MTTRLIPISKEPVEAESFLLRLLGRPSTFGSMINALRACDEIGQAELARKVGISRAFLCDIEKERRTASVDLAKKLAKAMGYSVPQFVGMVLEEQVRKSGLKFKVRLEAA